jgi:hypothetical protein
MFNKKSLIVLFLTLHLTNGLKSTDFCIQKQNECKGFYDKHENYFIKCNPIKCHGKLSFDCGSNVCSKDKTECYEYSQLNLYMKMLMERQTVNTLVAVKYLTDGKQFKIFNKEIKDCAIKKIYNFQANDFCVNGKNCIEMRKVMKGFGYNYVTKQIDCKCPIKLNFKCGKYCTSDSNACDYYKSMKNENHSLANVNDCGNQHVTFLRSYFNLW